MFLNNPKVYFHEFSDKSQRSIQRKNSIPDIETQIFSYWFGQSQLCYCPYRTLCRMCQWICRPRSTEGQLGEEYPVLWNHSGRLFDPSQIPGITSKSHHKTLFSIICCGIIHIDFMGDEFWISWIPLTHKLIFPTNHEKHSLNVINMTRFTNFHLKKNFKSWQWKMAPIHLNDFTV